MELEAESVEHIHRLVDQLSIDKSQFRLIYGIPISVINEPYKHYDQGKARLIFANAAHELGEFVTKNHQEFEDLAII
ncbi:MAG: hypothetical protein ACHQUC_03385 [Chlamydiales bacterium]